MVRKNSHTVHQFRLETLRGMEAPHCCAAVPGPDQELFGRMVVADGWNRMRIRFRILG
jgi:hypothetical protein